MVSPGKRVLSVCNLCAIRALLSRRVKGERRRRAPRLLLRCYLACCMDSGLVIASSPSHQEPQVKRTLTTLAFAAALALTHTAAHAEGCTKGAVVGGVAGHVAGDHGVAGAAAGCAIGHHEAKKKDKAASAAAAASQPAGK